MFRNKTETNLNFDAREAAVGQHSPWPSSGSELLVVVMSLRPDSSDASASEEVSIVMTSLASKYSATESATEGARWLCRPIEGVLCETTELH